MPRINLTGRKRVPRKHINCHITQESADQERLRLDCTVDLSEFDFPSESKVVLEAYFRARVERVPLDFNDKRATVSSRLLELFHHNDPVLFRLKIVSTASRYQGLLLGSADGVRPEASEDAEIKQQSLLPVRSAQLSEQVWRLVIGDADRPVLEINDQLPPRPVSRNPVFLSTIYADILRRILTHILLIDEIDNLEDAIDWQHDWIVFAEAMPGVPQLPGTEEVHDKELWIERAVDSFARRLACLRVFQRHVDSE